MNREDIIRMAREAGLMGNPLAYADWYPESLERFADLVSKNRRKPLTDEQIMEIYNEPRSDAEMIEFARAIEAAHGIFPENSDCHGPDWTDRDGEYLK